MESVASNNQRLNRIVATTDKGKRIVYEPVENSSLLRIKFEGGGQMPREFLGNFSDLNQITKVVKSYLAKKPSNASKKAVS